MPISEFLEIDPSLTAELLKVALDSAGIAVCKLDPRTRRIAVTTEFSQMLGIAPDGPVDYDTLLALVHSDDRGLMASMIAQALDPSGDGGCTFEYRILMPAGQVKWVIAHARALFVGEGEKRTASLLIGTARDITEGKASQAALQAALDQKQLMLQEINHRVKNSLQLVSSLLRLQSRRISDPLLRHHLEDATARISTIAHIHERLYRDQNIKRIDFRAFLSELCADLRGADPECSLDVVSPRIFLSIDHAIPLALITNELIGNAFKYAYPGAGGPVSLTIERPRGGQIVIRVSDQGIGLPDGFVIAEARSLGMILVASLLTQLSGTIEVAHTGKGATFVVTAPVDDSE